MDLSIKINPAPKRILLCASSYYPRMGGVEEVARSLAIYLKQSGYDVVVATNRYPEDLPQMESVDGVEVHRFDFIYPTFRPVMLRVGWKAVPGLLGYLNLISKFSPDLVHVICAGPNTFYTLIARLLRKFRLLISLYGETFADNDGLYQHSAFARWSLNKLLDLADGISGNSQFVVDDLQERFARERIQADVIFCGIDLDEGKDMLPAVQIERKPFVLAVGRLVANKGFALLIRAFASISRFYPEVQLRIAGGGEDFELLKRLIQELGVGDSIVLHGRIERSELLELYDSCQFFVCPSPIEAFGLACLEGMRAGKAVIAPNRGGPLEFIRHGIDGLLIDTTDEQELAQAITKLLNEPQLLSSMSAAAQAHSLDFADEAILAQYMQVYDRICPELKMSAVRSHQGTDDSL